MEDTFLFYLKAHKLPLPIREFKFHDKRKWRFDFAYPEIKLAIEIEGGVFSGGRHTRGKGFENDCCKYNNAVLLGWRVLRFTSKDIKDLSAIKLVEELINKCFVQKRR